MTVMIELSEETRDKLSQRGGKEETNEQIIIRLLKSTERKPIDIPEEFEDYWQLEEYFKKYGGFVVNRKTGPDNASMQIRVPGTEGFSSYDVFYKLKDRKFRKCSSEERIKNIESLESNI